MTLTTRPAFIPLPEASAFPPELLTMCHWVAYNLEERDSGWTKVPINPRTGNYAKTNDAATWDTFEVAYAYARKHAIGVGFMLAPPLFGFDLDGCIVDGVRSPIAESILGEPFTYAEPSVSGTGIKGIGIGKKPGTRCRRKGLQREIYDHARLFALTGQGSDADSLIGIGKIPRHCAGNEPLRDTSTQRRSDGPFLAASRRNPQIPISESASKPASYGEVWSNCRAGPVRAQCAASGRQRVLRIRCREEYSALQATRRRQGTPEFAARYAARAGIEGTISQGIRCCDLRRARYIGLAKTELNHLLIGAALNFPRAAAWFAGTPRARTRGSAFAALADPPA